MGSKRHLREEAPTLAKKKKSATKCDSPAVSKSAQTRPLPPHKYILAPMVGGSELAFRLLCRRYATPQLLCYTPMMDSGRFVADAAYRNEIFQTSAADRPLVAHFSGNQPDVMLAAARLVQPKVDAVDLNLGCPQRIAHSGHFGSFLLDDADRPLVLEIVRTLASNLSVPVFCKIRLLETTQKTIELCASLRDAGAALIAIHARHRVNLVGRCGPGARDGPALLEEVSAVKQAVTGVPIIANGNVQCWQDVLANLSTTGADGIMSAEGLLDDPTLFLPTRELDHKKHRCSVPDCTADPDPTSDGSAVRTEELKEIKKLEKKLRQIKALEARVDTPLNPEETAKVEQKKKVKKALKRLRASAEDTMLEGSNRGITPASSRDALPSTGEKGPLKAPQPAKLALEYLDLALSTNVNIKCAIFHVRRMAKEVLLKYQLMEEVLNAQRLDQLQDLLQQCVKYDEEGNFVFDPQKAQTQKEALQIKKWREATRKRFEERMVRKALRSNLPKDYYLNKGIKLPTAEDMARLRALSPDERWAHWQAHHSQHCWALHFEAGGCQRERTCAFIHADIAESTSANDPTWLQEKNGL